mmetsp:Transcript_15260/g.39672  ORF Transcript_15260/g.39672 Transcript_15260/m.39672 type:complete len:99 (-) Transcript_15260:458-754(-)
MRPLTCDRHRDDDSDSHRLSRALQRQWRQSESEQAESEQAAALQRHLPPAGGADGDSRSPPQRQPTSLRQHELQTPHAVSLSRGCDRTFASVIVVAAL